MTVHGDDPLIVLDDDWELDEPADEESGVRRRRGRVLFGLLAVAGLLLASVIVTALGDGDSAPDRPDTSGLAAVEPGALPRNVTEIWSTRFVGSGNSGATDLLLGEGLAVVIVNDGSSSRSLVTGVDLVTGEQLWRRSYPYSPAEMSPLLVHDGVVVIEQNDRFTSNRLIGIGAADGADRWERRMRGVALNGVLDGTPLIVSINGFGSKPATYFSPASGEPVGSTQGQVTTTDLDGTWYLANGSTVLRLDLTDGWSEPVAVGDVDQASEQRVVPVDGRLLALDAGGRLAEVRSDGTLDTLHADGLPPFRAMWPSGDRTFVGIGNDEVLGVELLRGAARPVWSRDGTARQFALSAQGLLLVVGDPHSDPAGETEWLVVDGTTGAELTSFRAQPPGGGGVQFGANGFVTSPNGSDHDAFDLDGSALWSLENAGKLAIGDGVVVTLTNTESGFHLTGYR